MTDNIVVRSFRYPDLESVYELVRNTMEVSYRADYPEEALRLFKIFHSRLNILENAANYHTLVALVDGEIAGTGTLQRAHIRRVFISPQQQGRGIGKLIVAELEKKALAEDFTTLDLAAAVGSRTFWESRGFTVEEERFAPSEKERIIRYYTMSKNLDGRK